MDWSKAKNVLIVALILVNLFLLGNYLLNRYRISNFEYTKDFIKEAEEMLESYNIGVDAKIPSGYTSLSSLRVSFESPAIQRLNERFFDSKANVKTVRENFDLLTYQSEQLSIIDQRRFLYEKKPRNRKLEVSQDEADAIAKRFLNKRGYSTEDLKLVKTEKHGTQWDLVYTMVYNNDYVESSHTNFTIDNGEVVRMDRLWIDVREVSDTEQIIVPAAKALLSLLDKPNLYGNTIVKIDPCYYFNPEEQGAVETLTKALQGRATPAWRVEFSDGTELVLDN